MKLSPKFILEIETKISQILDELLFDRLLKSSNHNYEKFLQMLINDGYIPRKNWGKRIGDDIGCAYLPLNETFIDENLLELIPREMAEKYSVIPVYKFGRCVTFAVHDPQKEEIAGILEKLTGLPVSLTFSFKDEIDKAILMFYGGSIGMESMLNKAEELNRLLNFNKSEDLTKLANQQEIKDFADTILYMALKEKASDIHIEPKKHHLLIRFRIDGILYDKSVLPREISSPISSRYKIMARVDVTERRRPQDGHFEFKLAEHSIDVRLSALPSLHGEKIVMRLLGTEFVDKYLEFKELGFSQETIAYVEEALSSTNGMLFVTGPTGSGKSTTLHCAINYLSSPDINIVTIEDPVEYQQPNITQTTVDSKSGRDFSVLLRAILRQDPDVIMIGEVRDLETAQIAANAALTGHMVLTSLHTNDSIQAMTRMIEMGVEHFVIAPSVIGVLSQRLVRKICINCKESYEPDLSYMKRHFDLKGIEKMPYLYRGAGCKACNQTGFSGRTAIHEFLGVTPELRECILKSKDQNEFYAVAKNSKYYRPFTYDGMKKVLMGKTTIEEISRTAVTFLEK